MRARLIHPRELGETEIARWKAVSRLMGANSAFMEPEFAVAAGVAREDARVALFDDEAGRPAAFWAFHKRPFHFARPIGAPFSDQHGPVVPPDAVFDAREAIRAMGVCIYAFTSLYDPACRLAASARGVDDSYIAEIGGDGPGYVARLQIEHKRYHKTMERRRRKAEREIGAVEFTSDDPDPATFETLLAWKRAQYGSTGLHDVLRPAWAQAMIAALRDRRTDEFGLRVSTLRIDGALAAGEISLLGAGTLHSWITAYDPELSAYSPGLQLLRDMIEHAGELGARRVDLGIHHGYYKRYFAFERRALLEGSAFAAGPGGHVMRALIGAWRGVETAPLGPVATLAGKVRRRGGQIAAAEPDLGGRLRGVARAIGQRAPV